MLQTISMLSSEVIWALYSQIKDHKGETGLYIYGG